MTGNHRPTGIFALSEPVNAKDCSLLDVAPTILAALEVPAPPMEGRALLEGSAEPATAAHYAPAARVYSDAEAAAVEERLRNLGYFD